MRRYLFLVAAGATALLTALPVVSASAATTDVLTSGKLGGPNVPVGNVLTSGLSTGTSANFFTTTTGTTGIKCTTSSFSAKVTANPAKPGTAAESLTSQTFSSCTSNVTGVTAVKSVTVNHLPYKASVGDSSGFPVTVSPGTTGAIQTTIVLNTVIGTITCVYKVTSTTGKLSGHASNTNNSIKFTNQSFTKSSGSSACLSPGFFSATYAPVVDSSITGKPKVFVN